ncbi:MAG: hypothetical protein GTO02_06490 [Candidatus Dadabacteria bacterium]|nr:hypothetical protein [Candidatus Dadabacteria bacterium]
MKYKINYKDGTEKTIDAYSCQVENEEDKFYFCFYNLPNNELLEYKILYDSVKYVELIEI